MSEKEKARVEKLEEFGRWVKFTCDVFGASPHTGHLIAGVLMKDLAETWEKKDAKEVAA